MVLKCNKHIHYDFMMPMDANQIFYTLFSQYKRSLNTSALTFSRCVLDNKIKSAKKLNGQSN